MCYSKREAETKLKVPYRDVGPSYMAFMLERAVIAI